MKILTKRTQMDIVDKLVAVQMSVNDNVQRLGVAHQIAKEIAEVLYTINGIDGLNTARKAFDKRIAEIDAELAKMKEDDDNAEV